MIVSFIQGAEQGWAEYNPDDGSFTWSYDGSNPRVIEVLETLESSKYFRGYDTSGPDDSADELDYYTEEESYLVSWEKQIEHLASYLEDEGFKILYLGE